MCGGIRNRAERLTVPTGTYVWSATGNIGSSTAPCLVNPSNGPFGRMLASEPAAAEGVNPENWEQIHTPPTLQSYTISGLNSTSSSQHAPMIQSSPSIQSETSLSSVAQVITKSFDSKHTQVCNVSSFPNICQLTYSQSRYYAQSPRKKTVASPCSHSTACHQSSSRG